MGKRHSVAKAMNISVVGSYNTRIKKANIIASDAHNSRHDYKNQEIGLPPLDWIYEIPSSIRKEWGRMGKTEKIAYGTVFLSTVIGLGIAADYKYNDGKTVKKIGDYSKGAGKKAISGASGFVGGIGDMLKGNQAPVADFDIETPNDDIVAGQPVVFNASKSYDPDGERIAEYIWTIRKDDAKGRTNPKTQVTTTPIYVEKFDESGSFEVKLNVKDKEGKINSITSSQMNDRFVDVKPGNPDFLFSEYVDEEFKVRIKMYSDPVFSQNVKRILDTWKEVDPEDYADKISYAPKRIRISPDRYSWYGYGDGNDYIKLPQSIVDLGGSDDKEVRKGALPYIHGEFDNAKEAKTGIKFPGLYEGVMDDTNDAADYAVKIGVMSPEQAEEYKKFVSDGLKSGEIWKDTGFEGVKGTAPFSSDSQINTD